jgi:hypothetical protein
VRRGLGAGRDLRVVPPRRAREVVAA